MYRNISYRYSIVLYVDRIPLFREYVQCKCGITLGIGFNSLVKEFKHLRNTPSMQTKKLSQQNPNQAKLIK